MKSKICYVFKKLNFLVFILVVLIFILLQHQVSAADFVWKEQINSGQYTWSSITSSADGNKLVATVYDGYIYTSSDSGVTWTERTTAGSRSWSSITSSADGNKLAATAYDGYIYTSTDGGVTWKEQINSGQHTWSSITSSADGSKLAATVHEGFVYTSADNGATWMEKETLGIRRWISIASSSDGKKIIVIAVPLSIYTSSNGGETWIPQNIPDPIWVYSVASSSDGGKLAIAESAGYIYTSTDSGVTWTQQTNLGQRGWSSITSSADGNKLAAVSGGNDNVYTLNNFTYQKPVVITSIASSITKNGAYLNGAITYDGGQTPIVMGFDYGLNTKYGLDISETGIDKKDVYIYKENITGLTCNTTYHYRAKATNNVGSSSGEDMSFKTIPCLVSKEQNINDEEKNITALSPTNSTCEIGQKFNPTTGKPCIVFSVTSNISSLIPNIIRTLKLTIPRTVGDDVKQLQIYLTSKGYDVGTLDGVYGTKSSIAIARFQKENGLKSDGVLGPLTIKKMK